MPIQKIGMLFYKNVRPVDMEGDYNTGFNTSAPLAKYYRKTNCCGGDNTPKVQEVYKNVKTCCNGFTSLAPRQANTAFPFDDQGNRPDYYQTLQEYRQARCKTFKQKQFNFERDVNTNEALANCCPSNRNCRKVIYKPSNEQFSTQGAVDSSTRLLRLKYNNITTSAKYNQFRRRYKGDTIPEVLLQNAPTNKPYKNGHKTVCNC